MHLMTDTFLCLYFSLQALLFVMRTLSISSLIGAAGFVTKGNAVAELTRKVIAEKITIDRIIYGFPHMTSDARRRSRALSRIANIVGLHPADFLRAPTRSEAEHVIHQLRSGSSQMASVC